MIFSSLPFILFFLIFLILLIISRNKYLPIFIFISSYFFYAYQNFYHSFIILFLAFLAILQKKYNFSLKFIIPISLLPLILFKYSDFFIQLIWSDLLGRGIISLELGNIPIGISFVTFTIIAYFVDIKKGEFSSAHSNIDLMNYIFFFPQLIAGPILRPGQLINQLQEKININFNNFHLGMFIFSIGIFKKIYIADTIGQIIDPTFINIANSSNIDLLNAFLLFPFQIYYDFSGYTDMAIGLALVLNISLPENFNMPYLTRSIREFWQKWHITLSNWIRDYIYIPLGGSEKSSYLTLVNIILAMSLSGLWHGASYNFLIWGFFNGIFIALERIFERFIKLKSIYRITINLFIVFNLWVLFRCQSLLDAIIMYKKIYSLDTIVQLGNNIIVFLVVIFMIFLHKYDQRDYYKKIGNIKYSYIVMPIWIIVILLGLMLSQGSSDKFIYFDF